MDEETYVISYLACPYSDGTKSVRHARYEAVTHVAAQLVKEGKIVFSPITMTHPYDVILAGSEDTLGSDYWVKFDEAFMSACGEFLVLSLPRWETSSGIAREIEFFKDRGIEPKMLEPGTYGVTPDVHKFSKAFFQE